MRSSSVEKLLHVSACAFTEGHNGSKVKFCCASHKCKIHCYSIFTTGPKTTKCYPSCSHDKSLATRLEIWLKEKNGRFSLL